jgi:hypothetical protein
LIEKIQKPLLLFPAKGDPQEYHPDGDFFISLKARFPTSASYPFVEENHGFWPRGSKLLILARILLLLLLLYGNGMVDSTRRIVLD